MGWWDHGILQSKGSRVRHHPGPLSKWDVGHRPGIESYWGASALKESPVVGKGRQREGAGEINVCEGSELDYRTLICDKGIPCLDIGQVRATQISLLMDLKTGFCVCVYFRVSPIHTNTLTDTHTRTHTYAQAALAARHSNPALCDKAEKWLPKRLTP